MEDTPLIWEKRQEGPKKAGNPSSAPSWAGGEGSQAGESRTVSDGDKSRKRKNTIGAASEGLVGCHRTPLGRKGLGGSRGGSGWAGAGRERGRQTLLHHTGLPSETLETVTQGVDHVQGQWPEHMMNGISQI